MQVIETVAALRQALEKPRRAGRRIGLVPTMGYLHKGHMALADRARAECDVVVLTIFVNPTQFGPNEDLASYPRDLPGDLALAEKHGVDIVFAPAVAEMYPEPIVTEVDVTSLSGVLIGRHRPGHFKGVATVVAKLFNIAEPDAAYFGEKDYQQLAVIRRMVADLSMRVAVTGVPTVREPDGLACSSRNARLTPEDRVAAVVIPQALALAERLVAGGERDVEALRSRLTAAIGAEPRARLQSLDICDARTLAPLSRLGAEPAVVLVTAHFGGVLLIDQRVVAPAPAQGGRP